MKTAAQWLADPNTYTTSVMALLLDKYTVDFLDWDPLSLAMDIKGDFGLEPDDQLMDKIGAGSSLLLSDLFFKSLEAFNATCNTLNLGVTTSETFLPADIDDIHWSLVEARLLLGEDFEEEEFSHDISRFVAHLLAERGVYEPPPIMSFAEYDEDVVSNMGAMLADDTSDIDFMQAHIEKVDEERASMSALVNSKLDELMEQLATIPIKDRNDEWFSKNHKQ